MTDREALIIELQLYMDTKYPDSLRNWSAKHYVMAFPEDSPEQLYRRIDVMLRSRTHLTNQHKDKTK